MLTVRYPSLIEKPAVEGKPLGYSGGILCHGRIPVEFNRALPSLSARPGVGEFIIVSYPHPKSVFDT
jgi:hypothetical protein